MKRRLPGGSLGVPAPHPWHRAAPGVPWTGVALACGVLLPSAAAAFQQAPTADACIACHVSLEQDSLAAPARDFETDVHAEAGLGCLECHGRRGDEAPDPAAGFINRPARREIPRLCGECHADAEFMRGFDPSMRVDQLQEYLTSGHGKRLGEHDDPDVATCVSCHPAHRIRPPSDTESSVHASRVAELCGSCHGDRELMERHDLPSDPPDEYRTSVHGKLMYEEGDLSAPTCNDCHGNHGAAPPGLASVANVCGQCHARMDEFFTGNGHPEYFADQGMPGCVACHGNHAIEVTSDEALAVRSEEVCARCHGPEDPTGDEFLEMERLLDSLKTQFAKSEALLVQAENAGMEVSQALFELEDVNNALMMARTAVHSFRVEPVKEEVDRGLERTRQAWERGLAALADHRARRVGLGVSAAVMAALVLGLLLKIRDIETPARLAYHRVRLFFYETMMVAGGPGDTGTDRERLELAATGVLLDLTHTDPTLTDGERRALEERVRARPGMEAEVVERLLECLHTPAVYGQDFGWFISLVREHYPWWAKVVLVRMLADLIAVNPALSGHEADLVERATARFGLLAEEVMNDRARARPSART